LYRESIDSKKNLIDSNEVNTHIHTHTHTHTHTMYVCMYIIYIYIYASTLIEEQKDRGFPYLHELERERKRES